MSDLIKRQDSTIWYIKTYLTTKDTYRLKVKSWKKIYHACRTQNQTRIASLMSDKTDFKYNHSEEIKVTIYQ
jgi:ribosomal protein S3AE